MNLEKRSDQETGNNSPDTTRETSRRPSSVAYLGPRNEVPTRTLRQTLSDLYHAFIEAFTPRRKETPTPIGRYTGQGIPYSAKRINAAQ